MIEPEFRRTSIKEFLPLLSASEGKLELIDGEIVAFAGGTTAHGILCTRIVNALSAAAGERCQVFTSDMAVQRADAPTHVFPDASYTCEKLEPDAMKISSPSLVVEVISRESESRDRVRKLDAYQKIPSVQEYLMVESRYVWACVFRRFEHMWTLTGYGVDDTIELFSVKARIALRDLYAGTGRLIAWDE